MVNHVNIIDYLKRNAEVAESNTTEILSGSNIHSDLFKPKEEQHYFSDNMLTIDSLTMPIKKWLVEDPVSLHRTIVEYNIWIEKEDFKI